MIPGITAITELPLGVLPAADRAYVDSLLPLLMSDPDADLTFVLKVRPLPSLPVTGYAMPYAVTSEPIGVLSATEPPAPGTVYLASKTLITDPDDEPANTIMRPLLINPLNFEQSLARDGSGAEASGGVIEIFNPDGDWASDLQLPPGLLDELLDGSWVGWPLELWVGGTFNVGRADERTLKFKEYGLLFRGTAAGRSANFDTISIAPANPMARLATVLNPETFAGTGGIEGGSDIAGLNKPWVGGQARRVPGIPLDSFLHIFFFGQGPFQSFDTVQDGGADLTLGADYPTYEALAAATVTAGTFATCKALGCGRCGAPPTGQVTATVKGDASGAGYVDTPGALVRRLATTRGAAPLTDPDELDAVAFARLEALAPYVATFYTGTSPVTVEDACRALMASVGGFAIFTSDGKLTVGLDGLPAEAPVDTHTVKDIGGLLDAEWEDPVYRWQLGYRRNWSPAPADSLGLISADLRFEYSNPERVTKPAESRGLLTTFPLAQARYLSTLLDNEADANAVRDRLLARDAHQLRYQTFELLRPLFQVAIGETRGVQHYRQALAGGLKGVVVKVAIDVSRRVNTVTLRQ